MVPCQFCRKSFKDKYRLKYHVKKVHKKTVQLSKDLPCTWCLKTFVSDESLKRHMNEKCGRRPKSYSCKLCDETFVTNYRLMKHKIVHMDCHQDDATMAVSEPRKIFLMVPCQYCHKSFNDDQYLMNHMKNVHREKLPSLPCSWCSKTFVSDEILKRHMNRCGKRPKSCNVCGATFVTKYHLKKHKIVHTN